MSINDQTTIIMCDWRMPVPAEPNGRLGDRLYPQSEKCGEEITYQKVTGIGPTERRRPVDEHGEATLHDWLFADCGRHYCPRHSRVLNANDLTTRPSVGISG